MRVVFIGGIGRSGSTLAERVLGQLPTVCALGEVVQLWQRVRRDDRCGCGVELSACEFWSAVGDHAFGGWHNSDLDRALARQRVVESLRKIPRLAGSRLTGRLRELVMAQADHYTRIYAAAASVTGASVVVDSSKCPGLAFCLRWARDVDLRVVHLVRDPRGVAYSFTKRVHQPAKDGAEMMPRLAPAAAAMHWNIQNGAFELLSWAARRGGASTSGPDRSPGNLRMCRIRYEDLLADPRESVRGLAAFAGLPSDDVDVSHLGDGRVDLGVTHSVAGNPVRFNTGSIPLRRDDAWRSALPLRQRRVVNAVCAPLLTRYGYPLTVGP